MRATSIARESSTTGGGFSASPRLGPRVFMAARASSTQVMDPGLTPDSQHSYSAAAAILPSGATCSASDTARARSRGRLTRWQDWLATAQATQVLPLVASGASASRPRPGEGGGRGDNRTGLVLAALEPGQLCLGRHPADAGVAGHQSLRARLDGLSLGHMGGGERLTRLGVVGFGGRWPARHGRGAGAGGGGAEGDGAGDAVCRGDGGDTGGKHDVQSRGARDVNVRVAVRPRPRARGRPRPRRRRPPAVPPCSDARQGRLHASWLPPAAAETRDGGPTNASPRPTLHARAHARAQSLQLSRPRPEPTSCAARAEGFFTSRFATLGSSRDGQWCNDIDGYSSTK